MYEFTELAFVAGSCTAGDVLHSTSAQTSTQRELMFRLCEKQYKEETQRREHTPIFLVSSED